MPRACHKNVSSQNSYGFVLKNDKHMVIWHLNMAIWDCRGCMFTAQLTMFIIMNSSLQYLA